MLRRTHFLTASKIWAGCFIASVIAHAESQPGVLDPLFSAPSFNQEISSIVRDGDRYLTSGWFTEPNPYLVALLSDGSLDPDFDSEDQANSLIDTIAVAADGSIYIAGSFTQYGGQTRFGFARLLENGDLDDDFVPGNIFNGPISAILPLPDGGVIVGGAFSSVNGQSQGGVARLNADGSHDQTFQTNGGTNHLVNDLALLNDGRIVVGGNFSAYGGLASSRLAVLQPNGQVDENFGLGSGFNGNVTLLLVTSNQQLLVGGSSSFYNGTQRQGLALLNQDGSLALNFDPGSGASGSIHDIVEDSLGRLVIAGNFTSFDGEPRARIARILQNGNLDLGFEPETGASSSINAVVDLGAENGLLIGGTFTSYDGVSVPRMARVIGGGDEAESGFATWLAEYFISSEIANPEIGGFSADPDGDGVPNLVEYALGGNPTVQNTAPLPVLSFVDQQGETLLQLSFVRRRAAWDVFYVVESSEDLQNWNPVWSSEDHPYQSSQEQFIQDVIDVEPYNGRRFLRLTIVIDESAGPIDPTPSGEGYSAWAENFFTEAELNDPSVGGPEGDPDNDGIPNLLEFAFGGDPTASDRSILPVVGTSDAPGEERLTISFSRLHDDSGLTYEVEGSSDLSEWTLIWSSEEAPYSSVEPIVVETVEDSEPINDASKRFLRVNVIDKR